MNDNLEDVALRLQSIIDTAIDGIITIDDKGFIESINKAAAQLFEYNQEELIGNNIKMLMPEPYKKEHDGYLERYNRTKEPRIIGIGRHVLGLKKSQTTFPFSLAVSEVILNDRVIFTGIIHDLTEVKQVEKELKELNSQLEKKVELRTQELEATVNKLLLTNNNLKKSEDELNLALSKERELNELKSRFVSMASHEFRTPLSTILSSASLISKYTELDQNEKREKHVERIKSAVNNLTGILNDFLSLGRIEEGKEQVVIEEVNMNDLCDIVKDEVKGLIHKKQIINVEFSVSEIKLATDKRILKNILFNLLRNAIKYTNDGGEINCRFIDHQNHVEIIVQDDGIGIPEKDQKYLFERFFRATNVENIQGTGLGLNIVSRYIDLLGGKISFKSKEGIGTTFSFTLPK